MFEKFIQILKIKELRGKILFVLAMLAVFRVAAAIPVPGVDADKLKALFESNQFFGLLNIFSGGAFDKLSIMMLGVAPYITASIIFQLLTMIFPKLKEMYYESGEQGRQKFNQYSRLLTVPLGIMQSYALLVLLQRQQIIENLGWLNLAANIAIVVAGTVFLMWIGELISEKGIGNGVSIIIFAGIVSGLPQNIRQTLVSYDPSQIPTYLVFLALALIVIVGVVFITEGQRNIPINYAKRVRGFKMYGGVSTYLPLRVSMAGVIPIIFAISIMLFPQMASNFLTLVPWKSVADAAKSAADFFQTPWFYDSLYFILVVLFTYFYTAVTFDPKEIAENLQKQGGYVPGIRPGFHTAEFLYRVLNRITLVGAVFLGLIAVLPYLVKSATGIVTLSLGGTSLLIVVSVVIDIIKQANAQITMREYEGF